MAVYTEYIHVSSLGRRDVVNLNPGIKDIIEKSEISDGTVTVFVPGSTAAITTLEYEPGLKKDINYFLDKLIPYNHGYFHHETWNDDNGSSHVQAAIIGPSESVPMVDGKLCLGRWQQVVLIDCDTRPRQRKVVVQIVY